MSKIKLDSYSKASLFALSIVLAAIISVVVPFGAMADSNSVNVWWPTVGSHVTGVQPFKAQVPGMDVSQYEMFWAVDNGTWNKMDNNSTDYPHKEASVDLSSWTWHGSGPYVLTFIAQQNGAVISQQSETIYVDNGQPLMLPAGQASEAAVTIPVATPTATIQISLSAQTHAAASAIVAAPAVLVSAPASVTVSAPAVAQAPVQAFAAALSQSWSSFYVNPNSSAANAAKSMGGSDQSAIAMLAAQPTATWFGNWNSDVHGDVQKVVDAAAAAGATPVLVAYNIPERDCGGFSSGGSDNPSGYQSWIGSFASAIGNNKAIVVLEPDALAEIACLSQSDQATRLSLLSGAVSTLKANGNTKVYIDAGHSNWIDAGTMAGELQKANLSQADGFSLNVSNFNATNDEIAYGQQISNDTGGKHFVVDTSRNGNGSNGQWCNPSGMAIGQKPTTQTGNSLVDAFLWVKAPGESDGNCNGGPSAGQWWGDYALSLVKDAH